MVGKERELILRKQVAELLADLSPEEADIVTLEFLKNPLPSAIIDDNRHFYVGHDDDGDEFQTLNLTTPSVVGDVFISTDHPQCGHSLRYRTLLGGGRFPHVHQALRILAVAMNQDNKDKS